MGQAGGVAKSKGLLQCAWVRLFQESDSLSVSKVVLL